MIVAARVPSEYKKKWRMIIFDMMADMLQIEINDYIFLWKEKTEGSKSSIYGVFRAISRAYYEKNDEDELAVLKIRVEKAYDFKEPVLEYDLLNCSHLHSPLWNLIGKKVCSKPRASSPLTPEEEKELIMLLAGKNPGGKYIPPSGEVKIDNELKLDYNNCGTINKTHEHFYEIDPSFVTPFTKKHIPHYEKVMEGVFNQEFLRKNDKFFSQIGIDIKKVIWHANYLPYSLEKSEMDYIIMESEDGITPTKIYVIDFQLKNADFDHVNRCIMYSRWVHDNLALGSDIVYPIIIAQESPDFINDGSAETVAIDYTFRQVEKELGKPVKIYTFSFTDEKCILNQMR